MFARTGGRFFITFLGRGGDRVSESEPSVERYRPGHASEHRQIRPEIGISSLSALPPTPDWMVVVASRWEKNRLKSSLKIIRPTWQETR